MEKPRSRLDELSNIILNVASKKGSKLNLSQLPGSQLKLPEGLLTGVPAPFKSNGFSHSLTRGFEYFSPGKKAVILGSKNQLLNYIAARQVAPGGTVASCFSDTHSMEQLQEKFNQLAETSEPLADMQFHYTPNGSLRTRYDEIEKYLQTNALGKLDNYLDLERFISAMKQDNPLIQDNSVDIVAFDVLDFNASIENFWRLVSEAYRVLKKNGIFLFSLLLSDEEAGQGGYLCEADMGKITTVYKFYGMQWLGMSQLPTRVIDGKEIRHYNFAAFKGKEGPCKERLQAVIYNGPWREARDDDGHVYPRGKRVAVCDKTFNILKNTPYSGQFTYLEPYIDIPLEQAPDFPCAAGILYRHPKETKGISGGNPAAADDCGCSAESCCS